ncbi:MAG: type IX secretion system sortase PorU, partial [Aurantibacter sp.]
MAFIKALKYYQLILLFGLSLNHYGQNSSVLQSGQWAKLGVTTKGIHKIDFETILNAGFDPSSLNTDNLQLYGQGGGMLPQSNAEIRADDLLENAVYTVGLEDNSFDQTDYILFFSEGSQKEFINDQGLLEYQKNLYADTTYYFLTLGTGAGKRMEPVATLGSGYPEIVNYTDYRFREFELENILSSGRQWFGPLVTSTSQVSISFENIPPLASGSTLKIVSSVMNRGQESSNFNFSLNGLNLGAIEAAGVGSGIYDDKGVIAIDTLVANESEIDPQSTFNFTISYQGGGNGLFDYLQFTFQSPLAYRGSATYFRSPASLNNPLSTFKVANANEQLVIWEVTDPQNATIQEFTLSGDQAIFGTQTNILKEYVAFSGSDFPLPIASQPVNNQNLHGIDVPNLLIVSHPLFLAEAERLAAFRSQNDQLDVQVVTPEEIYNEFSSGRQDVTAIRDFARFLYLKDERFRYLLLFGRCSYDYKNITDNNTNYVPTYQSRNSVDPIYSYNSDDYYGFLDDDEGTWSEELTVGGGHLMDIGVGRLPIATINQSRDIVDKLIHYGSSESSLGSWRQDIYYVADDGDFNLHQRDADHLATMVDTANQDFNVNKIYMDAFPQEQTPNGESADAVNQAIEDVIKKGALIINYTG